ncbi:SGNH/GDSL hydrolase family protein [uncultured Ruminococcus sp.]|uniref:SGNH/GDSL hydrolase family protein n=1 Tax=uncultured Ruminococcus sp. TaxID=165186 RepID=UPI0025E1FECA|nr:SGNH/GDSL hydrolase family protein [uncultured Ruminococcus sp.]
MWKKRLAAVLSAGAVALSLCSCSLKTQDMIEEKRSVPVPPKMVFLGDSIAAGYGLDGYDKDDLYQCESYANILGKDYTELLADECGHTMINDSVSGDTSQDLLDLLDSGAIDEDLKGSDAVVVSIGGNDVLNIIFSAAESLGWSEDTQDFDFGRVKIKEAISKLTSMSDQIDKALDGYEVNLAKICDELHERTDGEIYVQTLYNPVEYFKDWKMLTEYADGKIDRFNEIVKDGADADGVHHYTVIDVGNQFEGRNSQLTNIAHYDIHPNADGHKIIAEAVDKELRKGEYSYIVTVPGEEHYTDEAIRLFITLGIVGVLLIGGVITVIIRSRLKKDA